MAPVPDRPNPTSEDTDGVTRAVEAYVEGYITGDPAWHGRAYHAECIKRRLVLDDGTGVWQLDVQSPRTMVDYAATGRSVDPDAEYEIVIDAIDGDIAAVRCYSTKWVDFLHLVKARGEWRLFHVSWRYQPGYG